MTNRVLGLVLQMWNVLVLVEYGAMRCKCLASCVEALAKSLPQANPGRTGTNTFTADKDTASLHGCVDGKKKTGGKKNWGS